MSSCASCRFFLFPASCSKKHSRTVATAAACDFFSASAPPPNAPAQQERAEADAVAAFDDGAAATLPSGGAELPVIPIKVQRSELARRVYNAIPRGQLYQLNTYGSYIRCWTVTSGTQRGQLHTAPMTDSAFTTWVENFCAFVQLPGKKEQPYTSISEAQARFILDSEVMQSNTPLIEQVTDCRLPIRRRMEDGKWRFVPAPLGFDEDTGIFTPELSAKHDIDWHGTPMSKEVIRKKILDDLQDFPFDGESKPTMGCRSVGAVVTAMLGQFLRLNIDHFPLVAAIANQSGAGKSFVAKYCFAPAQGRKEAANKSEAEDELRKSLAAALMDGETLVFLDDITSLSSGTLNRYITEEFIADRIIGTAQRFKLRNRMQFFATGKALKTTPDIERRLLPIDIFVADDATARTFSGVLSEQCFGDPAWRREKRQLLWDMVRHWEADGCPHRVHGKPGFEQYNMSADIAVNIGFADPYGPRQVDLDTGDTRAAALKDVLCDLATLIVSERQDDFLTVFYPPYTAEQKAKDGDNIRVFRKPLTPDQQVKLADYVKAGKAAQDKTGQEEGLSIKILVPDLIAWADKCHKKEIILTSNKDESRQMGWHLRTLKGQIFTDRRGRLFAFGDARSSASTQYTITILSATTCAPMAADGTAPPADDWGAAAEEDDTTPFDY